jgi:predicted RNA polymerase sigma factor
VHLKADTSSDVLDISGDCLRALQRGVGGLVQALDLKDDLTMWVNEEGKLQGLPVNENATVIFAARFRAIDLIVGDIVLTGGTDDEGEVLGLTDQQAEEILAWAQDGENVAQDITKGKI